VKYDRPDTICIATSDSLRKRLALQQPTWSSADFKLYASLKGLLTDLGMRFWSEPYQPQSLFAVPPADAGRSLERWSSKQINPTIG
jgi:hypothetical protein